MNDVSLTGLQKEVRAFGTAVWPALFHMLSIQRRDGLTLWTLSKNQAIELVPAETSLGLAIRRFRAAVLNYSPNKTAVEEALTVVETGVTFLDLVKKWWTTEFADEKV